MKKEYNNFNVQNLPGNIDAMKSYFEKRNATCIVDNSEKNAFKFSFLDTFHSQEITVNVLFNLKESEGPNLIIEIEDDSLINPYNLEDYSNQLLSQIYMKLMEGPTKYIVRVYGRYYSVKSQVIDFTFDLKSKIKLTSVNYEERSLYFNADRLTSSPHEQLLYFDIEVFAIDITSARTLAYNQAKEAFSFLAVLFDLGIDEYQSEQVFVLLDEKQSENNTFFHSTTLNRGFYDQELDLFVFDNLNGLVAVDSQGEMVVNSYLTYSNIDNGGKEQSVVISKDIPELDNIFKNRLIEIEKNDCAYADLSKDITYYNSELKLLSSHISFFRKLKIFEEKDNEGFKRFSNACRLYNKALYVCANEPTMMTSYLISSVEALLKIEIKMDYMHGLSSDMNRFLAFADKYSEEENFEKEYFKYLYGTIRSGHFHSGDFKFMEYSVLLNHSLSKDFINARNDHIKARTLIRSIFINWIETNILEN